MTPEDIIDAFSRATTWADRYLRAACHHSAATKAHEAGVLLADMRAAGVCSYILDEATELHNDLSARVSIARLRVVA